MYSIVLPSEEELRDLFLRVSRNNPGIGVYDTLTGQVYLVAALLLEEGDHASLVRKRLRIIDYEAALHLRGFVVGIESGQWIFANDWD